MIFWAKNKFFKDNPMDKSRIKGKDWSLVWNKVEFQIFSKCFSTKLLSTTWTSVKHYTFDVMTDAEYE